MNFLRKEITQIAQNAELHYPKDRDKSVEILIRLQKGFCAYSERYLKPLDSVELEHFDPRKKNTATDGFTNWHAVIRWMNAHKARSIEKFQPLPDITSWVPDRVWYEHGQFVCREEDQEARNLIDFLGVNHYHDDNVSGHPLPVGAPPGLRPTDKPGQRLSRALTSRWS